VKVKSKILSVFKLLLLIFLLAVITAYLMCLHCRWQWEYVWPRVLITYGIWLIMWFGNQGVSHGLDQVVSWLKEPVKRFILGILGASVYSALAMVTIVWFFDFTFNIRIADNLGNNIFVAIFFSVLVLSIMLAREFLFAWRKLALKEEKMKNEILSSKFELLKNQVNPHFMFNSLNTLSTLIYQNQELATRYVGQLSNVYRSVLDAGKSEVVHVREELKMLKSYAFLQSIRFEDQFRVDISLDEETENKYLPPMVLQMLVENAIKHNVVTTESPLLIQIYREGDSVCVKNKIAPKSVLPGDTSNIGLSNIRDRYKLLSDPLVEVLNDGSYFTVKLPLLTLEEYG